MEKEKVNPKEYADILLEEIKKLEVFSNTDNDDLDLKVKKVALLTVKLIKAEVDILKEEFFDKVINEL